MSFSFDASKTQSGLTIPANLPTTTAAMPFTFGVPGGGDAAKPAPAAFPAMVNSPYTKPAQNMLTGVTSTTQSTGFSFGTSTPATPSTGMVLGSLTAPAQTSGLSFGASTTSAGVAFGTTTAAPTTGFSTSLGNTAGFSLGSTTVTTTAPATTGWSFETPKSTAGTAFSLGGGESAPAQTAPTLNFGTPSGMTTGFHLGSTTGVSIATTTTASTVTSFSLGGSATTTTTAITSGPGLTLDATKTTGAQPAMDVGFSFGAGSTAAVTTTVFGLNKSAAVTAPSVSLASTTTPSLGTTTTVTSSTSGGQLGAINFCQLEESINKWTLELEEQDKVFVNQATQINAWDKLLIANGEKIVTLNQEVERVKIEQQQLEHELDYVVGQQKELQDCLEPLEKELVSLSVSDPEREYTYRLAENLDTQLKQMSEDLKEIIEHLNEANRSQDSSDPIVQIGKILNAHMNSLQWLDQRTALLSQKIQQIDQMHQNFRQENERSFSLAYT